MKEQRAQLEDENAIMKRHNNDRFERGQRAREAGFLSARD